MIDEVIVLCGGYGERLGELTQNNPKPLVKAGKKHIIEHSVRLIIKEFSPKKFLLAVGYKGEQIKQYLGNGSGAGTKIDYVEQNLPNQKKQAQLASSQITAVLNASKQIQKQWFWLYSGDYVFSKNFLQQVKKTKPAPNEVGILFFKKRKEAKHTIRLDNKGYLVEIGEKIKGNVKGSRVFYGFSKKALKQLRDQEYPSFNAFLNDLTKIGKVRVELTEEWMYDIDTPDDLKTVTNWLQLHPTYET